MRIDEGGISESKKGHVPGLACVVELRSRHIFGAMTSGHVVARSLRDLGITVYIDKAEKRSGIIECRGILFAALDFCISNPTQGPNPPTYPKLLI
jgi:hypothetical protein